MTTAILPAPVQRYVDATNAFDGEALATCFCEDALVNDARREFWGATAIRRWLEREIVGDKVTMDVTSVTGHHGDVVVNAVMDGDYDKSGLAEPLVLTHYFTVRDDRIVRLIIIHNEPVPAWAED